MGPYICSLHHNRSVPLRPTVAVMLLRRFVVLHLWKPIRNFDDCCCNHILLSLVLCFMVTLLRKPERYDAPRNMVVLRSHIG